MAARKESRAMDDESRELLRQLIDAQREQTELLRRHVLPLWTRIRFSLLALLVLMTLAATGIGFTVLAIRTTKPSAATPQSAAVLRMAPTNVGTIELWPAPTAVNDTLQIGGDKPTLASPAVSP
jgi:hypothetical protein